MIYTEEKKAIEDLRKTVNYYNERFEENGEITAVLIDNFDVRNLFVLLNLVEKQQKEIDRLENKDNEYMKIQNNNLQWQEKYRELNEKSLSKEAIREKIEELKDNRPYLSKFDDWKEKEYTNEDINNMCVEVLEDLLGE